MLNGRCPLGPFKDTLPRRGIADQWYRYHDAALEEIAIEFLETHGFEFRHEPRKK